MTVHAYLARAFETTHENEVFDAFVKRADARWAETDEDVVVIDNSIWIGSPPSESNAYQQDRSVGIMTILEMTK